MPIYRLSPVLEMLKDPDWGANPVRSDLWVNAADEKEARLLASGRYEDAGATIPGDHASPSPWLDRRLVSAALSEPPSGMTIPNGVVVADRQM